MEENDKPRFLVADDDYGNVELIIDFLKDKTDQVLYAPNGKVALEIAKENTPDIIIMDWQMPELDGIEAIKKLKKDETTAQIPIIVATGVMTSMENLKEAFDSGAVDFLRKPYNIVEFHARTESILKVRDQHETIKKMLIQENEYAKELLSHKERELASMALFDFQKNTLINNLLEQVNRLDRITNYVYATDIKNIQKELKAQLNLNKSWDTFKKQFEEVHAGFFEKLNSQFPSLTQNEHKHSSYIKMGLSNFEICEMTGISDASLRKAINRLKKKLNLGPKDNIRKFLIDF